MLPVQSHEKTVGHIGRCYKDIKETETYLGEQHFKILSIISIQSH